MEVEVEVVVVVGDAAAADMAVSKDGGGGWSSETGFAGVVDSNSSSMARRRG